MILDHLRYGEHQIIQRGHNVHQVQATVLLFSCMFLIRSVPEMRDKRGKLSFDCEARLPQPWNKKPFVRQLRYCGRMDLIEITMASEN
ncbi:hypothetical protein P5673_031816 [Acropora cervicornis]|uniref:Uncharacterized protein n=1 Tax=Acropora cervicornis TaxID=6130 RepID=A0AAD9PS46_ACRCE|nr:hypothetical protein P5673_031816 [Acropora cervicornis]